MELQTASGGGAPISDVPLQAVIDRNKDIAMNK